MSTVLAPRTAVLAPYRDWLRTTTTGALCGLDTALTPDARAVYAGGLPAGAPARSIVITKVGVLTLDRSATETTLLQFDCRAERGAAAAAEELAAALKTDLEQLVPGRLGSSAVRHLGAQIEGEVALPDPDDGAPRFVVTASVTTAVVA